MAFCRISFIGNLGRDPEMRYTPQGKAVTEFSVAVSYSKPDGNGGWEDQGTDWFRCTVWGQQAEGAAERLRKGNKVFIEGRFKTRTYQGKDGAERTSMDVTADTYQLIGAANEGGFQQQARPAQQQRSQPVDDDLDDLPF